MDKRELMELEQELLEHLDQFEKSYDHGSHRPFGTNKETRAKSQNNYENAIFFTLAICRNKEIYSFLEEQGEPISIDNQIWEHSKPGNFRYDLKYKLLPAIRKVLLLLD
jgi:hypothetical protein